MRSWKLGLVLLALCGIAAAQTVTIPVKVTVTPTTVTLVVGSSTTTIPVPVVPPNPTPQPTSTVYANGVVSWTFNMSYGATVNYADTVGNPGGLDAAVTVTGSNGGGWQPGYSVQCQNGGTNCFQTSSYTNFVFNYKPTQANTSFIMAWHSPGDVSNGNPGLSIAKYCSNPAVGTWGNCIVPLSAFGFTTSIVSKFTIQTNNPTLFYVNNVGFQ